jgi:hypothetical protein
LVLAAIALVVMGLFGQALPFDGAEYFLHVVDLHHFTNYFQRYSGSPFEVPTLFLSGHTSNLALLRSIFGLSYAVAPFGALLASWLVVRRRNPGLMVWPVLGIGIVGLPGLLFPISESVIVAEWAWPLLLLTLVSLDGLSFIAGIVFSAFLFFLAANSLVVFVAVAVVAVIRAVLQPTMRSRLIVWTALMLLAAIVRDVAFHQDFAAHPTSLSLLGSEFQKGEFGLPFVAYLLAGAAGVLLLVVRQGRLDLTGWMEQLPTILIVLAGICVAVYASQGALWYRANLDRDVMVLLELPFLALAVIDQLMPAPAQAREAERGRGRELGIRGPMILVTGVALVISLGLWSASWSGQISLLRRQLAAATTYCVSPASVAAVLPSAVESNANGEPNPFREELAIEYQTRTPAHIVISATDCRLLTSEKQLVLFDFNASTVGTWFRISGGSIESGGHVSKVPPTITSFKPQSGAVGGYVIIKGTNLSGATRVTVGGVPATIVKDKPRRLRINIPAGAKTGKIEITTPEGTVKTATNFTVT